MTERVRLTPNGSAYDMGIRGILTLSLVGLIGHLCLPHILQIAAPGLYTFGPAEVLQSGEQVAIVVHQRDLPAAVSPSCFEYNAEAYPYNPPVPQTNRDLKARAFLDQPYRDQFAADYDAVLHADLALEAQETMWTSYTGNTLLPPNYFKSVGTIDPRGDGDYCNRKLQGFSKYLNDAGERRSDAVHILISGDSSIVADCFGAAWGDTNGTLAPERDNLNYGKNSGSYKGKSNFEHLGKLIAHEVGHNWGERGHPCGWVGGEQSIMCDSHHWESKRFWLHYGTTGSDCSKSTERIISGTAGYDGTTGSCA
jgi:hypothetical protein